MREIFYRSQAEVVRLGQRVGIGGEGEVYEVRDQADLVAKIYYQLPPVEKAEKLMALIGLGSERLFAVSAWPIDVLRDRPDGQVVGVVMKRISRAEEVHALHSPKSRLQKFPEASWAFLLRVAADFARAVAEIHEHGFVIGDLNPKNTLVTRQGEVFLLDCDSFQISIGGKTFRCEGGFPEYTPPELQGASLREIDRTPEHDCFSLAVVIFQLLFLGRHPFSGRYLGSGEMPLARAIGEFRFAYGPDAESRQMARPPGTLALEAVSAPVAELFCRAFLSASAEGAEGSAADRPRAGEWAILLDALANSLRRCVLHNGHQYYDGLSTCPWCEIETGVGLVLFNFMLGGADQANSHFRLDEIWKGIETVAPPPAPPVFEEKLSDQPAPSKEAQAFALRRSRYHKLLIVLSVPVGLIAAWVTGNPFSIALLILIGSFARWLGGIGIQKRRWLLNPLSVLQPVPADPLVEKIRQDKCDAEDLVRQVEQRWEREAHDDLFSAKLSGLRDQKRIYENLSRLREAKLDQLEGAARAIQFDQFLDRFSIYGADIAGIDSSTKAALLACGIGTAADVTGHHLKQVPALDKFRTRQLLQWRQELEEQFEFDPDRGISPVSRLKAEREIHDLRLRLEHELVSGAFYLNRMKQELEESRHRLFPELITARRSLAQAEKDYQAAIRSPWLKLVVPVLIVAFLSGWIWLLWMDKQDVYPGVNIGPPPKPMNPYGRAISEGEKLYERGKALSGEGKYEEAVDYFQDAVNRDELKQASWLHDAHSQRGYALYRLQRYQESIAASKKAIEIYPSFDPYFNLGLVYLEQGAWIKAEAVFRLALTFTHQDSWAKRFPDAYYKWAFSVTRMGNAVGTIQDLESSLTNRPTWSFERFKLVNLYLCTGQYQKAKAHYQIIKEADPLLARELERLLEMNSWLEGRFNVSMPHS